MFEKWRESLDKGGRCGALFIDLSKSFDSLLYEVFIISQTISAWISCSTFKIISSFLSNRKYRTKMNFAYGNLEDLLLGVPQESVLEPLPFFRYMCHLVLFITTSNIANYAIDKNLYVCNTNIKNIIKKHENETLTVFEWFETNSDLKFFKSQILNTFKSQSQ